ncbi:MAG: DUF3015 family protein [Verrucomicrobiota bacterium]
MKKLLTIAAMSSLVSVSAMGAIKDNCGCGLGTMIFGDRDDTLMVQLLVATFNHATGSQTFGITTGSMGCLKYSEIAKVERIHKYVADNMDHLAMDMALGYGQSLDALADLLEMEKDSRKGFYTKLQSQFDSIYSSDDVTAKDVVTGIARVIQS